MIRAVIRLRSDIKANREVKETLRYLRLNRVNHCVLVPEGKSYDGMLQKVKDFVTWGEVKPEVLTNMILRRGRLTGDRPITSQYVAENTKYASLVKLSEAIISGQYRYADLKDVKPVFRLHPPIKGLESVKRAYTDKGSLGYRKDGSINDLIGKMLIDASKGAVPAAAPKAAEQKAEVAPVKPKAPAEAKAPARKVAPKADDKPKKAAAPKKAPAAKKAAPPKEG